MVVVWQRQLLSRGSQFHAMRFNYMRHAFRLEVLRKHAVLRSIRLTLTWITERSRSMSSCVRHWRDNYLAGAPFMREKTRVEAAVATQGSKALVHEAIRPSQLFAALLLRTIVRDRNEAGVQQVAQANKAVLSQIEGCLIVWQSRTKLTWVDKHCRSLYCSQNAMKKRMHRSAIHRLRLILSRECGVAVNLWQSNHKYEKRRTWLSQLFAKLTSNDQQQLSAARGYLAALASCA